MIFGSKGYFVVDVFGQKKPPSIVNVPSLKRLSTFAIFLGPKMPFIFMLLFLG
jgi:hypothetical protein